jgi:GTPase SAR1 family protein
MRFVTDRCVVCGVPRPHGEPNGYYVLQDENDHYFEYKNTREWCSNHYWFCSEECYYEEVHKYMPETLRPNGYKNDPEYKKILSQYGGKYDREEIAYFQKAFDDEIERYFAAHNRARWDAQEKAKIELRDRLLAEHKYEFNQRLNKTLKDEIKDIDKQIEKERKAQEACDREYERLAEMKKKLEEQRDEELERIAFKKIPPEIRFEHTHILGPSGSGKSSLIQDLILEELYTTDKPNIHPAYIVIDPKGTMVERLSRLAIFAPGKLYGNSLIVIDPTKPPLPALDIFHHPTIPGDERQRTRVLNQLIETFAYIFSTANARLTQRQSIPFAYVVRLVFSMGGNINTMMDILEDSAKDRRFYPAMQKLGEEDEGARRFFENDFYTVGFNETRQQIKTRLYEIISKPELMAMLAAGQNKLSLFDCMQQRKIVLINTAMPYLGSKASQLLGRYFIAATLNAAFARSGIPKNQWTPAFLVIDEFQDFADEEKTSEMLRLAREYNLGITIAHQNLFCTEFNDNIRSAISTNTSIKYAASPEGSDLNYMARDMRCEPEWLKEQANKSEGTAAFAVYARGMNLKHPFLRGVQLGGIDGWAKMKDDVYARFMQAQRDALKADPKVMQKPLPPVIQTPTAQQPAPDPPKPRRELETSTQPATKSPPTDPHTGDHSEPASKWGDQ